VSLVARHLETNGIATVVIGSAQDIVETAGVPRFVFVDYPLGNPLGKPDNIEEQFAITTTALNLVRFAQGPRTTQRMDLEWGIDDWRANYMHVGPDNADQLAEAGRQRQAKQTQARHQAS
jgi:D-proline reductase (dithiol) PrdB